MKLSSEEDFMVAKEFIVQGLACKLGNEEMLASQEVIINTKPRDAIIMGQQAHPEDYDLSEIVDKNQKEQLIEIKKQQDAIQGQFEGLATQIPQKTTIQAPQYMSANPYTKTNPVL